MLLYLDESQSASSAVIYSAILMLNMPNMYLTVVKLKERYDGSKETEKSWINTWLINPILDMRHNVMDVFSIRAVDVRYQVLYCNPNIPDTVDALLDYARKQSVELIVMGTGEFKTLKSLIFGSLANTLQYRSQIPVLFVKDLPQEFIESYRSKPILTNVQKLMKS